MSTPTENAFRHDIQPGFWLTVLGSIVAILAPLFGLLGGAMSGGGSGEQWSTLVNWLVVGLVVGGLGVLAAFVGGLKWWRATHV